MARQSRREFLERELASQLDWVRDHGGDLAGYVERYGSKEQGGMPLWRPQTMVARS